MSCVRFISYDYLRHTTLLGIYYTFIYLLILLCLNKWSIKNLFNVESIIIVNMKIIIIIVMKIAGRRSDGKNFFFQKAFLAISF